MFMDDWRAVGIYQHRRREECGRCVDYLNVLIAIHERDVALMCILVLEESENKSY